MKLLAAILGLFTPLVPTPVHVVLEQDTLRALLRKAHPASGLFRMDDERYESVELAEVKAADRKAWRAPQGDKWDCDDQVQAVLLQLRAARYHDHRRIGAPAAGRIDGTNNAGVRHAWVWFVDAAGRLRWWDAGEQREVAKDVINHPWAIYDK